jgi:hypothetical protein
MENEQEVLETDATAHGVQLESVWIAAIEEQLPRKDSIICVEG